jgi:hypothetical protein
MSNPVQAAMLNRSDRRREYFGPPAPEWATRICKQMGQNYYGEDMYRLVWADNRVSIIGGYWQDDGTTEYRLFPKDGKQECWVLEKYCPPEKYGDPLLWEFSEQVEGGLLGTGPFPERGEYESCWVFKFDDGEIIPIDPAMLELVLRLVDASKVPTLGDKRQAIRASKEKQDKEWRQYIDDDWSESQRPREELSMGAGGSFGNIKRKEDVVVKQGVRKTFNKFKQM